MRDGEVPEDAAPQYDWGEEYERIGHVSENPRNDVTVSIPRGDRSWYVELRAVDGNSVAHVTLSPKQADALANLLRRAVDVQRSKGGEGAPRQ